jgi:hypothetical protein
MDSKIDKNALIKHVQQWVLIDRQLKTIHEKTKELREKKHQSAETICQFMTENPIYKNKIVITGGELRVYDKKEYSPLTFQYIEECLGDLISDKEHVETILQHIKSKRTVKTSLDISIRLSDVL